MWWPRSSVAFVLKDLSVIISPTHSGRLWGNIINVLSGNVTLTLLLSLSLFKFISWAICTHGTSGGTSPLLTISGACAGADCRLSNHACFSLCGHQSVDGSPDRHVSYGLCRRISAYLTSIAFALGEATMQPAALLPLLGAVAASYLISFFFMENTIHDRKNSKKRNIHLAPDAYAQPDILRKLSAGQIISKENHS